MEVMLQFMEERDYKIKLGALIHARNHLGSIQEQRQFISVQDVKDCFFASNYMMNNLEIDFHTNLLMDTCAKPCYGPDNRIRYMIREDMLNNDVLFTTSLLNTINLHVRGDRYAVVQDLKKSVGAFLVMKAEETRYVNIVHPVYNSVPVSYPQYKKYHPRDNFDAYSKDMYTMPPRPIIPPKMHPTYMPQQQYHHARKNIETCEPIVRFLAQIRKQGMDILFPQDTHDKILCSIFVAVQITSNPAHRELIDMVMAVKESGMFPNLQSVSKTKIRGILALLKHSDVMNTSGVEGLPVNLFLADGVRTFQNLRDRHDEYLVKFLQLNHLHMSKEFWVEIVWRTEPEFRSDRMSRLEVMIQEMRQFFNNQATFQSRLATDGPMISPRPETQSSQILDHPISERLRNDKISDGTFHPISVPDRDMFRTGADRDLSSRRLEIPSPQAHVGLISPEVANFPGRSIDRFANYPQQDGAMASMNDISKRVEPYVPSNQISHRLNSNTSETYRNVPDMRNAREFPGNSRGSPQDGQSSKVRSLSDSRFIGTEGYMNREPMTSLNWPQTYDRSYPQPPVRPYVEHDLSFVSTEFKSHVNNNKFMYSGQKSQSDINNERRYSESFTNDGSFGYDSISVMRENIPSNPVLSKSSKSSSPSSQQLTLENFSSLSLGDKNPVGSFDTTNDSNSLLESLDMESIFNSDDYSKNHDYLNSENKSASKRMERFVDDVLLSP